MKRHIQLITLALVLTVILGVSAVSAWAQGTVITYQGQLLNTGQPINGTNYSMAFSLYDAPTNGNLLGNEGITNVSVSDGVFTVQLNFGNVFNGNGRWLQIAVEKSGDSGFTTLSPLQQITPTPYAITAGNVVGGGLSAGTYGNAVTFSNAANEFSGTYNGNGSGLTNVAGALTEQTIAGTTVAAASNMSYVLTNNSLVSVTLPALPNPGDIIRISDTGYSGWQLLQNPGQSVLGANLVGENGNWIQVVTNASANGWIYMVSSPDGLHLIAIGHNLLDSQDGGLTWSTFEGIPSAPECESADGTQIAIAIQEGGIFLSTNVVLAYSLLVNWSGIVCSADFSHLAGIANGAGIYYSGSYGTNWAQSDAPSTNWMGIATSQDGSHLAAVYNNGTFGGIYRSSDFGTNWTRTTAPTNVLWRCVASSADGTHLAAAGGSSVYVSIDSGASWAPSVTPTGGGGWSSIACSADGTHLITGSNTTGGFPAVISTDFGATWAPAKLPSGGNWFAMASSAAGTFIAGDSINGGIYIYKTATTSGISGYLSGGADTSLTLQYMGNGIFLPVGHEGNLLLH